MVVAKSFAEIPIGLGLCVLAGVCFGCSAKKTKPPPQKRLASSATASASAAPPAAPIDSRKPPALPAEGPYFPFLPGENPAQSVSVGTTSHGYLVNGKALPAGAEVDILPRQKARDLAYGSTRLLRLLKWAGSARKRQEKQPLWVGNLGKQFGGDIPYSVSHNSGRDVDIAFAYRDAAGRLAKPLEFYRVSADGWARGPNLLFDIPRNWRTVKRLLSHPSIPVQFIFVSRPLKRLMLRYAQRVETNQRLLAMAKDRLRQPANSSPHDDHFHVRIFCGERHISQGCLDIGPSYDRAGAMARQRQQARKKLAPFLRSPHAEVRRRALQRVRLLGSSPVDVLPFLRDKEPKVRAAAAFALSGLRTSGAVTQLAAQLRTETHPRVRMAIYHGLWELEAPEGASAGLARLQYLVKSVDWQGAGQGFRCRPLTRTPAPWQWRSKVGQKPWKEAPASVSGEVEAALGALAYSKNPKVVPGLLALLAHPNPQLRHCVAAGLRMLTNRTLNIPWATAPARMRELALVRWRNWAKKLAPYNHSRWVREGFLAAYYRVPRYEADALWELVRALAGPTFLAENARRALQEVAKGKGPERKPNPQNHCLAWLRYFSGRRPTYRLEHAPRETVAACQGRAKR